jgi:MarR family 2-MHQ and catechol resistance regulon transcriptional repressor
LINILTNYLIKGKMKDTEINVNLMRTIIQTAILIMGSVGQKVFGPHGLTSPQYGLLYVLKDYPEGISFREIGDHLMVSKANISGLMARLEKKGLAKREASREDGRIWLAKITPKGEKLLKEVEPSREEVDAYAFAGLSRSDKLQFLKYLRRTLQRLKNYG